MNINWKYLACLGWAILIWYLTSTPKVITLDQPWFQSLMMEGGHFIFFGIQAVLFSLANFATLDSIVLTSLYGAIIEGNQLTIPGRTADPVDWVIDTLGAIIFLAIMHYYLNHKSRIQNLSK